MATYYTLFASVQQLTQPVVSVPYVDAFGLGKEFSLTKKSLLALMKRSLETSPTLSWLSVILKLIEVFIKRFIPQRLKTLYKG